MKETDAKGKEKKEEAEKVIMRVVRYRGERRKSMVVCVELKKK